MYIQLHNCSPCFQGSLAVAVEPSDGLQLQIIRRYTRVREFSVPGPASGNCEGGNYAVTHTHPFVACSSEVFLARAEVRFRVTGGNVSLAIVR